MGQSCSSCRLVTSYPSVARVVSQLSGRQLPVSPPMNRSTDWVFRLAKSSAGMKYQPRLKSSGLPLASPLPVMVSKLLSFWTNRVSLEV